MTQYYRKIRSFVRREGRLTKGQQRALNELYPVYGLKLDDHQQIDFDLLFANDHPVHIEIGFGNGQALTHMAAEHSDQNYFGIEVHRPGVGNALLQVEQQDLKNVRVIAEDAVEVLNDHIPDDSVSAVYIFFADPWHKKRHHKRRLIQVEFVATLLTKLKPDGLLHFATDWQDYAEHMLDVVKQIPTLENLAGENKFNERPDYRPITKFEQRGLRLGHGIWDLLLRKKIK